MARQLRFLESKEASINAAAPIPVTKQTKLNGRSGTFVDNMLLPVHRWYRYSAGFSAEWVRETIQGYQKRHGDSKISVLDPFAGVGTTLVACSSENIIGRGFENHPFIHRLAVAKLYGIGVDPSTLCELFETFMGTLPARHYEYSGGPPLLAKCYTPETLQELILMRNHFLDRFDMRTHESELLWLAITAILRPCSNVGTAQWQYVLPNKKRPLTSVSQPVTALRKKVQEIIGDIRRVQLEGWGECSRIDLTDARNPDRLEQTFDLVLTSPPYPNNYDYADATRLELTFWGEVDGWGDLQYVVRRHLIRSCSQHATADKLVLDEVLNDSVLDPIRQELSLACRELEQVRRTKGGKKSYHTMAAAYFRDMSLVFHALRKLCRKGATMCFVVGDSAPYGVYLDVDRWLGKLAISAQFKSYSFEKIRDRNIKWKNRKHRVPLKEGRLWIEG